MKWLVGTLISVLILALIGFGGYTVYRTTYVTGEVAGYESGYQAGYPAGQEVSLEEGYGSGKTDGYSEGYTSVMATRYEESYSSGETGGYNEGYASGMEAGAGHGYVFRDPTYQEAINFLEEDKTDRNEYIEGSYGIYVCSHFARDVCNNAEEEGLRCAYVELRYPDGGHAIIAFDTIDEGLVYFSAQSDEVVEPIIGKHFYQCMQPKPGYYYTAPSYDDPIMDILVIW